MKGKELGLNLSKVAENSLRETVRRLRGMKSEINLPTRHILWRKQ